MVFIFVDLCDSTATIEALGRQVAVPLIMSRLHDLQAALRAAGVLEQAGPPDGDGLFLFGDTAVALAVVQAAKVEQARWQVVGDRLAARIAIGVGEPFWSVPEGPDRTPMGRTVVLASRLLAQCPEGGIAITQGLYDLLAEEPVVRRGFRPVEAAFRGIAGVQRYWVWTPGGDTTDMDERERDLRERVIRLEAVVEERFTALFRAMADVRGELGEVRRVLNGGARARMIHVILSSLCLAGAAIAALAVVVQR